MFGLIRAAFPIFMVLFSLNVFLHVYALKWFENRKRAGFITAFVLAAVNAFFMRDAFTTEWMAAAHVSLVLIAADIFRLILRIFGKENRVLGGYRKLLKRGAAFFTAFLYVGYGLINIHVVRETEYRLKNPKVKEDITVALISDSHLGNAMDAEKLIGVMEKTLSKGADLIVLAGDIVDEKTPRAEYEKLTKLLAGVRAPKGIYFVFGNHDSGNYGGEITVSEMERAFTKAGVTVLTDETVLLDGWLRICGRKEAGKERMSEKTLLSEADIPKEYVIVIDHQPANVRECAEAGADLLISGHTHNGQIFPVNLISVLFDINEIEYGHEKTGDMDAIVSSGVSGWSSAFRTAGRSEYALIHLTGIE